MSIVSRVSSIIVICIFSWVFFVVCAQAGTYQTALAECQKRSGFGAGFCKTLIKNNLNVASCKKQTGLSDDECTQYIEEIKNDPEFSGVKTVTPSSPSPSSSSSSSSDTISSVVKSKTSGELKIIELRSKKERELRDLQAKTLSLINYFKNAGVDMTAIEKSFIEFEVRSKELLSAYDSFRSAYVSTSNDQSTTRRAIREEARNVVNNSRSSLVEYYKQNILNLLRTTR